MYCFKTEDGIIHERKFSMHDDIPPHIDVDGRVAKRCIAAEHQGVKSGDPWPLECHVLGVAPSQRQEAMRHYAEKGVPTEVNERGNPIITSRSHYRRVCRADGYFMRDGGYSDAGPQNL
jgi:hypothetical protein